MKLKYFYLILFIICLGLVYLFTSSYDPKITPSSCEVTGKLNSTLEHILPISCPNGKMFESKSIGYSNLKGDIVLLDENWINASMFYDNHLAIVTNNEQLDTIINKKGHVILDYEYEEISYLGENRYYLKKQINEDLHYYFGYYEQGEFNIQEVLFEHIYDFSEGLAAVIYQDKIGYINKSGEVIVPFEYDRNPVMNHHFYNGKAVVIKNGKFGIINKQNEVIVPFLYDYIQQGEKNESYLRFCQDDKWGLMNNDYEIILETVFLSIGNDSENIISVSINEVNYAFLNFETNQLITDFIYKKATNHSFINHYNYFQNQYAVVTRDSNNFNLLDKEGNEFFDNYYLGIKMVNASHILLKENENLFYLYNLHTGEKNEIIAHDILVYPPFNVLAVCNEYYEDGAMLYQLYDLEGNEIIPKLIVYDYMFIKQIDGKLYLYFNGELDRLPFSSYFDTDMNLIWKPIKR